jgi:hypothetical protein
VPAWFDETHGYTEDNLPGELYNLTDDLSQRRNLYGEMPERVTELTALLRKARASGQVR